MLKSLTVADARLRQSRNGRRRSRALTWICRTPEKWISVVCLIACVSQGMPRMSAAAAEQPDGQQSAQLPTPQSAAEATSGAESSPLPPGFPDGPWWSKGKFCGPNALYVLLKLHDLPVTIEQVHGALTIDPERGCSVEQLKIAGTKLGLPLEDRFVPAAEFDTIPRPFIMHGAVSEDQIETKGHFWIIAGFDKSSDMYAVVDGSSGTYFFFKQSTIEKLFSGWVLVPTSDANNAGVSLLQTAFLGTLFLLAIVSGALLVVDSRARRAKPAAPAESTSP